MAYVVINTTNSFDPIHQMEFASAAEADAQAREMLIAQPQMVLRTAQLISTYSAEVTVTAKPVAEVPGDTAEG